MINYNSSFFFFFNDTATTEIYTLSLHDALPILRAASHRRRRTGYSRFRGAPAGARSEEHTSELQSQSNLVCRLLLEKKKKLSFIVTSRHPSTVFNPNMFRQSPTLVRTLRLGIPI